MVSEGPKILIFSYLGVINKALASNPLRQWRRQDTARITPEFDSALHMLPLNMLVFGKSQPLTALLDPPPGYRLAGGMRSCLFKGRWSARSKVRRVFLKNRKISPTGPPH